MYGTSIVIAASDGILINRRRLITAAIKIVGPTVWLAASTLANIGNGGGQMRPDFSHAATLL